MIRKRTRTQIEELLQQKNKIIIEGGHKVGKTHILNEYKEKAEKDNLSNVFIDIETEKYSKKLESPEQFIEFINSKFDSEQDVYVFLDGIQHLDNPAKFLVKIFQEPSLTIIATTSSASYKRSKEYKKNKNNFNTFTLYSYSWKEFLHNSTKLTLEDVYKNFKDLQKFYKKNKVLLEESFPNLMSWGSYPSVLEKKDEEDKKKEIEKILHTTIEEEVAHKIQKRHMVVYLKFLQILAINTNRSLNYNKVSNQLDIHKRTLNKFVEITKDHFLFSFVEPFYTDSSNEISKMTKIYGNDFGMLNYLAGKRPKPRLPVVYERKQIKDFVFDELCRHEDIKHVYFYRTIAKAEIDFVAKTEDGIVPVEVNFQENTKKKSVALKNFNKRYASKTKKTIIITKDKLGMENNTLFIPVTLLPFAKLS